MEVTRSRLGMLLLLAAVPPLLQEAALVTIGFNGARGLAPQVTAVWPYDSFHDLRWLLVYHNSWSAFLLGLLALVVLRGLMSAALTALAWPAHVPRPTFGWLLRRNIEVAALALVIISPWAAISVAFAAVALSLYLFASLAPMLVLAPFLQRAGVVGAWWRGLPTIELAGWTMLNFAVLTVAGAVITSVPGWWGVVVAGLAGLVNGLLWRRTVAAAVVPARVRWARAPVAPVAIVLTMAAAVGAQSVVATATGPPEEWAPPVVTERLPDRVPHAVIAIAGHDSHWTGREPVDPRVERFSYAGLDARGRPRPYQPQDTHRSLDTSAVLLAAQVDALHRRTGRPVGLLGFSEGAMVARTYLDKWPKPSPVEAAILISPLVQPGRAYYPPPGYSGWGVAAGWELRGIFWLANLGREVKDDPDEPFVRSILVNAPFYRNRTLCPVAGVRTVAFLPTVSAAEAPPGEYSQVPVFQLPTFHSGIIGRQVAEDRVVDFLAGDQIDAPRREYRLLQRLGAAWQAPPLPLMLNPVWAAGREGDPAFSGRICQPR
ncbi:hypothetical protein [Micromonospora sp. NPDC050495]|uniref:hypothetical protein n=1 Tax=Micromonospora sp. NPDC050495 TaxID=3154936 RepID=UPI0033DEF505